jgi:hypothetical protein
VVRSPFRNILNRASAPATPAGAPGSTPAPEMSSRPISEGRAGPTVVRRRLEGEREVEILHIAFDLFVSTASAD